MQRFTTARNVPRRSNVASCCPKLQPATRIMTAETPIAWNNELIYKLIDLYKEKPALWDPTHRDYKDKLKKNHAWAEVAAAMEMDKDAVERKIKILWTQFRREIVKNENDESKWFAYKKLLFLKPRVLKALAESESINTRDDDGCTSSPSMASTSNHLRVKKHRLSDTESEDTRTDETYRIMTELYREKLSRDEFTVFGEHVALKLRKLDNLYARCTAQYHINNILYKAEIGEFDVLEDSKPYLI